jgi:hypothetical protein
MKIRRHSESHIVELDDGTTWRVFPGDLDVTINWRPDTDLKLVYIDDEISSHALISASDNSRVRVLPTNENWPVGVVFD